METDNFITEIVPKNDQKLESVEDETSDIFIQCLVFNKTIIPLTLVGYELMIADSVSPHLDRYLKAHIQRAIVE